MLDKAHFIPFPKLTTERLVLRQLSAADSEDISLIRSDDSVNLYIDRPKQTSISDSTAFVSRINTNIENLTCFYWAITLKEGPKLIGTMCLWNFSDDNMTAEVGYELLPAFQGMGIANEALQKVIEFAIHTIGFTRLVAEVHVDNARSKSLLLKNNFVHDTTKIDVPEKEFMIFVLRHNSIINSTVT